MMSISPMGAGTSIEDYYCDLAREDYFTKGGEPPGYWLGKGSSALTLGCMVTQEQIRQTLHGFAPDGKSLVQGAGNGHRAGWDCTFSSPKSVSVVWAVAERDTRNAIAAAHARAVESALQFIERNACHARRGQAGIWEERVSGMVAACFEHSTSREGDPHLHTHCLVHNLAQRADGSWGGIESLRLMQWKLAAGALYRAELASQMIKMGFAVERDRDSFRLRDISNDIEKQFSKRRSQIEQKLNEKGLSSAAASHVAALDTRSKKTEVDRARLFPLWAKQANGNRLDAGTIEILRAYILPASQTSLSITEMMTLLTQHASTFRLEDIYRQTAVMSQGVLDANGVKALVAAIMKDERLVALDKDEQGCPRFTTREMQEIEQGIARDALWREGEIHHHVKEYITASVLASRSTITAEQREALLHIVAESGGISLVQGIAGSGKSYLMDACREVYEKAGFTLRGCALSGKAAQGLQEGSNIPSQTLHSLLNDLDKGQISLGRKDVVVVDEAGMVGSRQFASLMGHAAKHGAKLVAIGDTRQLQPIDAGAACRILTKYIRHTNLLEIRRQRLEIDRQMVRDFAAGNAEAAILSLESRNLLTKSDELPTVMGALVRDWSQDIHPVEERLILTGTRAEATLLNNEVRQILRADGKLGAVNTGFEVAGGAFRSFSEGDRILFTRNNLGLDVRNGTLGILLRIGTNRQGECELAVKTDDGKTIQFSPTAAGGYNHLDHGYAMSVHKAQGATVSSCYLLASEVMGDREWAYVGASRAREETRLYCTTEMRESMEQTFSRSRQKTSTLDYQKPSADVLEKVTSQEKIPDFGMDH